MGKVSIVYWSGTGNTETMAAAMAEGVKDAGAEVELLTVDKAEAAALSEAKAFALGCPAMGAEELEEGEMEPFMAELTVRLPVRRLHFSVPMVGVAASGCATGSPELFPTVRLFYPAKE